jgi:RHS repeat-associated protein
MVADASGAVVKRIDYDSFGNIFTDTNPLFEVPFGFAGGLHDRDTGLVRFGYRDYDPDTGRWTAKDPIGFSGGDTDLWGYCVNDPINFIDPLGLINITKTGVGLINFGRGILAGASGAAGVIISVVGIASGVGLPLGLLGTGYSAYQFTVAFPGLMKRGLQQIEEGLNEDSGKISFGYWDNLLGLGVLGSDVDDPCETYGSALKKKKEQIKEVFNKFSEKPLDAATNAWHWLYDWAI